MKATTKFLLLGSAALAGVGLARQRHQALGRRDRRDQGTGRKKPDLGRSKWAKCCLVTIFVL